METTKTGPQGEPLAKANVCSPALGDFAGKRGNKIKFFAPSRNYPGGGSGVNLGIQKHRFL
jgi:hypothetical protein